MIKRISEIISAIIIGAYRTVKSGTELFDDIGYTFIQGKWMNRLWTKVFTMGLILILLLNIPGMVVLADEIQDQDGTEYVTDNEEEILQDNGIEESIAEEITDNHDESNPLEVVEDIQSKEKEESLATDSIAEIIDSSYEEVEDESIGIEEDADSEDTEELVGATWTVGDNVSAKIITEDGVNKLYFVSNWGTLWNNWKDIIDKSALESVKTISVYGAEDDKLMYLPQDSSNLFANLSIVHIYFDGVSTAKLTNMRAMFQGCTELESIRFHNGFNTSNVTDMSYLFSNCSNLYSISISSFDTSSLVSMQGMFENCTQLRWLYTPKSNTKTGIALPYSMYDYDGMYGRFTELPTKSEYITLCRGVSFTDCSITISPTKFTYDGTAKRPAVTIKDGRYTLIEGFDYQLLYSNNINAGTGSVFMTGADLSVYGNGETKYFTIEKATPVLEFADESIAKKTGDTSFINVLIKETDGTVTFKSSNTNVATIDSASGKVVIKGAGTTTITATASEGANYKSGSKSYTLKVTEDKKNISSCTVSLSTNSFVYDGKEKKPKVTVKDGTEVLVENTHYTIAYLNNINAGTASVKVAGKGSYQSTKTVPFTINKATPVLKFSSTSLTKKKGDAAFTNTLTKTTDGTVTFSSSKTAVATVDKNGKVTIKGIGQTIITATAAEGTNYTSGSAKYTITVVNDKTDAKTCTFTISPTSYTYNGKEKKPTVTGKDGTKELVQDTDFTVEYKDNINAGTGTVVITGMGNYEGTVNKTFTIAQASPKLTFAQSAVTKHLGDADFTNKLTAKTDGKLSYTSGDKLVATVNSTTGLVKIQGEGTCKITVKAATGTNYKSGTASYTLTVNKSGVESVSYKFSNSAGSFGYPVGYVIPLEAYYRIYGKNTRAEVVYKSHSNSSWQGNCVGMASTADLLALKDGTLNPGMFRSGAVKNSELEPGDRNSSLGISLTELIESFQIMQYTSAFSEERYGNNVATSSIMNGSENLNSLYNEVKKRTSNGENVILVIGIRGVGGHAMLAYGVSETSSGEADILLYDNNAPLTERKITLKKGKTGEYTEWSYDMGGHGIWGTDNSYSYITYISEGTFTELWEDRGNVGKKEGNLAVTNSRNVAIYDVEGNLEATVIDGKLTTSNSDIFLMGNDISLAGGDEMTHIFLPTRTYTVSNLDKKLKEFNLSMVDMDLGISVNTSARDVTVAVDDEYRMNTLLMDAESSDSYSVTLSNSSGNGYKEIVMEGHGIGDTIEISQNGTDISINNCEISALMIDGKRVGVYDISAQTSNGGTISPQGTASVIKGESQDYVITPNNGYVISDVFIDGESIGAVSKYTFSKVTKNHTILATFKKSTNIENASVAGVSLSYGYTGKAYTPSLTVKLGDTELVKNTDYTVKYENNINPGTAKITITGKGKYTGTRIKNFEIVECVSSLVSGKTYQLIPKNNSKTAVCSFSGKMVNNTKVYITDRSSSEAMKFKAVKNSDGTWKFINAKCELALAVQQNSSVVGAGLVLYDQTAKAAQNWKLSKKSDNSFAIINAVTGYSIAMSDASAVKGTTLSMAKTESNGLQRFYIAETSAVAAPFDGTYSIRASANTGFALNIASSSKEDGANVNLYSYSDTDAKKFKIIYSGGGYYRLINANSGLALTVKGNIGDDGVNVVQSKWTAQNGQRWKITKNSDGTVTFKNALGTVLHLVSNATKNGTNILAKKEATTKAQKWILNN